MRIIIMALLSALCALPLSAESLDEHARRLHTLAMAVDTHADTPLEFPRGKGLDDNTGSLQVSIPRLQSGLMSAQYLACWVKQGPLTAAGRAQASRRVWQLIDSCKSQIAAHSDACALVRTPAEAEAVKASGRIAFLLGVENGYGIGRDLDMLDRYADAGVSYVTLCHTRNNDICDSSSDKNGPRWKGLSPFGLQVVERMNSLGLLIDLSHASEQTFWYVLEVSAAPVACTHSAARALRAHDRNLTDDQLRAIAAKGGVVQVCPVPQFLRRYSSKASIDDYMLHLVHVIEVAGIDHTGIGTDFDGGGGVKGLNGSEEIINVTKRLIQLGYSDDDIIKILGGNFMRVLGTVQRSATRGAYAVDNPLP